MQSRWAVRAPIERVAHGVCRCRAIRYRSGFYWFDDEQKELILASKAAYEKALGRAITTQTAAAADYDQYGGLFYYAEHYHQQ